MRRQSKSVTLLYGGVALALLLVVATVALVVQPPSPPAVAEFAPRAEDQIDEALKAQSSRFGEGDGGGCAEGQACEDQGGGGSEEEEEQQQQAQRRTTTTRRVIDKARVRRCVGNPPRQTEDPQSPPCVNYWEGDNGGATAKGVTRDEIRIALPCTLCEPGQSNAAIYGLEVMLAEHFNQRYELYGRRLRVTPVHLPGSNVNDNWTRPQDQRSNAEMIDGRVSPFATLRYQRTALRPNLRAYYDEAARRGIISVTAVPGYRTSDDLARKRPFQWAYGQPLDVSLANTARFACTQLAGGTAEYAGPVTRPLQRKFALMYEESEEGGADLSALRDGFEECGAPLAIYSYGSVSPRTVMAQMREAGVTTVMCLCLNLPVITERAQDERYEPEWLMPGALGQDLLVNKQFRTAGQGESTQAFHVFGLADNAKAKPYRDEPWFWAMREVNPDYSVATGGGAGWTFELARSYRELLVLASGIQAAGPNLTPETFERALQRLRFPNPGAGAAPYWQGRVGFGPNRYHMTDDFALVWWTQGPANDDGSAGICYMDRGARWSLTTWPRADQHRFRFFETGAPCR